MNRSMMTLVILFVSACSYASLDMESGVGINALNKNELWNTSISYAIARQGLRSVEDNEYIVAFQDMDDYVFGLSNSPRLLKVQASDRSVIGSWPLTRWEGELTPEIGEIYEIPGKGSALRNPELLDEQYSYVFHPGGFERSLGCYMETPLRYGEVLSLPEKEIVVFLGRPMHRDAMGMRILDMVVLSPSAGGIAFAMRAARENQGPSPGDDDYYPMPLPSRPQFITSVYYDSAAPGTRSYAKMYTSDFNEDEKEDVIVWRKRYVSNNIENSVIGFHLDKDIVNHYTLVEGQYVLQETPEATVRSWLTTNNLTWQSGFPSRSECAGQEDQLIPEMHDPLLNDPDVLQ